MAHSNRVSRRDFLFVAAAGGGAVIGAGLVATPAAASDKMSPQTVSYRPSPNGKQRCDSCVNFQAPSSCKFVDGAIAPSGWCMLYRSK